MDRPEMLLSMRMHVESAQTGYPSVVLSYVFDYQVAAHAEGRHSKSMRKAFVFAQSLEMQSLSSEVTGHMLVVRCVVAAGFACV